MAGRFRIYDTWDFSIVADYNLAGSNVSTVVNDVVLTDTAAYITDSMRAQFYTVRICALRSSLVDDERVCFTCARRTTIGRHNDQHIAAELKLEQAYVPLVSGWLRRKSTSGIRRYRVVRYSHVITIDGWTW